MDSLSLFNSTKLATDLEVLHVSAINAVGGAGDVEFVDDGCTTGVVEGHDDDVVVLEGHLPGVRIYADDLVGPHGEFECFMEHRTLMIK